MKERPILMSGPLVKEILAGRKTMTRRPVKPQESIHQTRDDLWWIPPDMQGEDEPNCAAIRAVDRCPYGAPGDRLWVRETFIAGRGVGGYAPGVDPNVAGLDAPTVDVIYRADDGPNERTAGPWTPSIYMPRWASRLTLEVTAVRGERLWDITEEDARAEGVKDRAAFAGKWLEIYGAESWASNCWVWVISFRRLP